MSSEDRPKSDEESTASSQNAELSGDGAVAQGTGNKAVGRGGTLIERVEGNVYYYGAPQDDQQKNDSKTEDTPAPGDPPFKGLQYFTEKDSSLFFGRKKLIDNLLEHVRAHRFLAVVGASGSGKSSVVRAGVVAALRNQPDWRQIHIVTPTDQPLETLATALTKDSESVKATKTFRDDMRSDSESLHLFIRRLTVDDSKARILLLVDQFEELFTLCRDTAERESYVNNLMTAVSDEKQGPLTVILVFRADFYHHCMQYQSLLTILPKYQVNIGAMTQDELREAIECPAKQGDWSFEQGLVDLMLRDISDEPGALPLLSHALLETWNRRRNRTMTLAGYSEAGSVQGAIAKTAESTYRSLSPEQQKLARSIFLRLTELGEGTQDTRRRASLKELRQGSVDEQSVDFVLSLLADARLVTTNEDSVEVAHEALIREWPTLRLWLDEDRAALRLHRHLTETAQNWEQNQKDPGDLYRGTRLEQALKWAKTHGADMSVLEKEYLKASQAQQRKERQGVQLRWTVILGTIVLALLIVGLTLTNQLSRFLYHPLLMEWVQVPGGAFDMGSTSGEPDEIPVHSIYLNAFEIGKYEVTNKQYSQCVKAKVCAPPAEGKYNSSDNPDNPVVAVNWNAANTFCAWNDKNGSLPTEAQWEKAARGTDVRTYPWGEGIDCTYANYGGENGCVGDITTVASYEKGRSPYGAYNMAGNVLEWVRDWYGENYYASSPGKNPSGPESGTERVLRGGSWFDQEDALRSFHRGKIIPRTSSSVIGFRCVRALP